MGATQIQLREMQVLGRSTREWIVQGSECPAFALLGIRHAGVTAAGTGFSFCRVAPSISVVFGSLSGKGHVWLQGTWKECGPGDIYLAPAGTLHAYHAVKAGKWHLCWVVYEDGGTKKAMEQDGRTDLRRDSSQGLRNAIMGLYEEVHGLNEAAAVHYWAELVDLSARRLIHERQIDERLLALWRTVDSELGKPWTLGSLARRVHLSPEQLRHLCQRHFGRSPMKHLASLRMNRAAVLLLRTNQKIAAIADAVGYQDAFAFSTAFKRIIGTSPTEFLRTQPRG